MVKVIAIHNELELTNDILRERLKRGGELQNTAFYRLA